MIYKYVLYSINYLKITYFSLLAVSSINNWFKTTLFPPSLPEPSPQQGFSTNSVS